MDYLEGHDLPNEQQAGFRSGYYTIDHVFTLSGLINIYLSKIRKLHVAFVDYEKSL